jgi:hypothetical protein
MADGAVLIAGVRHVVNRAGGENAAVEPPEPSGGYTVVTLEAQGENDRAAQQARIHRAMRIMAGLAAVHADRFMLEDERTAFFGVALEARFFVGQSLVDHARARSEPPGGRKRAVRIVAIGTVHETFVHAMFERHGELRPDVLVAAITKVGLFLGE